MFTQDLTADRQADPGSPRTFGRFKHIKDGGSLIFGNPRTIVAYGHQQHIGRSVIAGLHDHRTVFNAFDSIDRV